MKTFLVLASILLSLGCATQYGSSYPYKGELRDPVTNEIIEEVQ